MHLLVCCWAQAGFWLSAYSLSGRQVVCGRLDALGGKCLLLGVVGMLDVTKRFENGSRMSAPAEQAGSACAVTAAASKAPTASSRC